MSVEEYFTNMDQRLNLKVAQGIKQAMGLVLGKIDLLLDSKLESKLDAHFHSEQGKTVALE